MGQVLLFFMISFKRAIGPAIVAFLLLKQMFLHRKLIINQYYQAYVDTSLLQTANLDMCNPSKQTSLRERRLFREFLVDAHKGKRITAYFTKYVFVFSHLYSIFSEPKAAYIPVCIAGSTTSILTSEPAVAVWTDMDLDDQQYNMTSSINSIGTNPSIDYKNRFPLQQRGAALRRVSGNASRRSSISSQGYASFEVAEIDERA